MTDQTDNGQLNPIIIEDGEKPIERTQTDEEVLLKDNWPAIEIDDSPVDSDPGRPVDGQWPSWPNC